LIGSSDQKEKDLEAKEKKAEQDELAAKEEGAKAEREERKRKIGVALEMRKEAQTKY